MKDFVSILLSALLLVSCAGGNADKDKARNDYRQALTDSIEQARSNIDSCENVLKVMTDNVNQWMHDFSVISNPREVESYYLFKGWENRYPLQSTGLVARISNGERLELIAALKGSTFNAIMVESDGMSATTAVVPHDQTLNYRRESLNTVMFSGEQADSVAQLIADNELNIVRVLFLENGKTKGSWQMPDEYKKMVSATWMLYSSRRKQMQLEARMKKESMKINILRTHLDK